MLQILGQESKKARPRDLRIPPGSDQAKPAKSALRWGKQRLHEKHEILAPIWIRWILLADPITLLRKGTQN